MPLGSASPLPRHQGWPPSRLRALFRAQQGCPHIWESSLGAGLTDDVHSDTHVQVQRVVRSVSVDKRTVTCPVPRSLPLQFWLLQNVASRAFSNRLPSLSTMRGRLHPSLAGLLAHFSLVLCSIPSCGRTCVRVCSLLRGALVASSLGSNGESQHEQSWATSRTEVCE